MKGGVATQTATLVSGCLTAAMLSFLATSARADASELPSVRYVFVPHSGAQRIESLDVRMTLPASPTAPGAPLIDVIVDLLGAPTAAVDVTPIAHDERGLLKLNPVEVAGAPYIKKRGWAPDRAPVGAVTISYSVPVATKVVGPNFTLTSEGQSVLGAGMSFVAVPADESRTYRFHLGWDLKSAAAQSIGVSAYGMGDVDVVGNAEALQQAFYRGGVLNRINRGALGVYWTGSPHFDVERLAQRTQQTFEYYQSFFKWSPTSYQVFLRENPGRASGTALKQSFVLSYDPENPAPEPRQFSIIAHEMAHTFIRATYPDEQPTLGAWYNEGAADYYSQLLPIRAGLVTSAEFETGLKDAVSNYYWAPSRALSIADAAKVGFFNETDVQEIAYGRGRLYLAQVNAKIRAKSGGTRSLDDVTLAINEREARGERHGPDVWLDLVAAEIGPEARVDHEAFLAGQLVVPPSDAFGPCFRRERADIARFDLGFDPKLLKATPMRAQHIDADSAAASAGLRDGDEVISYTPLRSLYRELDAKMEMKVRRDGKEIPITYLPRGKPIESYRWVRIAEVPEERCREM